MNKEVEDRGRPVDFEEHLLKVTRGNKIPKIIHQTFVSKKLPQELSENVKNLKRLNPDWVYRFYDDDDITQFILEHYGPAILHYFEKINPAYGAARADVFRYLVVYKLGGVYLDIKSTCNYPLNDVLQPDDQYILSQWRNKPGDPHLGYGMSKEVADVAGGEYQQWHIIAVAGHPFLRAVINNVLINISKYKPWVNGTGGIGVLRLTGPLAYTLAIQPLLSAVPYRLIANETIIGLQYSVHRATHHRSVYKKNYSLLTESIVEMKSFAKVLGIFYSMIKKFKYMTVGR